MALRENQVYQIGLIISVMLTVVLGLLAFFGFSSASQEGVRAKEAEAKFAKERTVRESAERAVTAMKIMIGAPSSDSLESAISNVNDEQLKKEITDVRTMFNNDLRLFASGSEDPSTRSYSSLVKNLITVVNSTNNSLRVETANVGIANTEKKADVDKANARADGLQREVTNLTTRVTQLQNDLETAKNDFASKLAAAEEAHNQGVKNFRDQIASLTSERDALNVKANKTEQVLNAKMVQLQQYERKKFLIPDGRIVDLSPTTGRVYLNLGFDDGLQRKISFSVFGRDVELEAGLEKATIEVTNILGPHSAEARIMSRNEKDPILPNDQIVTATWEPGGYKVPVAISGIIDLNGDGESDLERLKGFILKNQGELAAVMNEVGEIQGKIDLNTRYLIVGGEPQDDRSRQAFSKLDLDAGTYRVQKISVREFLHLNGFHPEPSIRSLDSQERSIDGFQPRRPPANGSAFTQ
ncbi:MAG: hypothetical protein Q8M16_08905 [Pirellulaceae bacterium]|nr:hypothetical protein [Pirellulaceae bacterium]